MDNDKPSRTFVTHICESIVVSVARIAIKWRRGGVRTAKRKRSIAKVQAATTRKVSRLHSVAFKDPLAGSAQTGTPHFKALLYRTVVAKLLATKT